MSQAGYRPNSAQQLLAEEVTRFVHGQQGLEEALRATQVRMQASPCQLMQLTSSTLLNTWPAGAGKGSQSDPGAHADLPERSCRLSHLEQGPLAALVDHADLCLTPTLMSHHAVSSHGSSDLT